VLLLRRLGAAALALSLGCATALPRVYEPRGPEVRLSLLVLGDWGRRLDGERAPDKQLRVAEGLADEDRHAPADGLLFVGDNFYPHGLTAAELEARLRGNVVGPYCHFVQLTDAGRASLGDSCAEPEAQRHPVPLWVVLGNHDHTRESIDLESSRVPDFVANWRMYGRPVETLELPQGVSFVFYDSTHLRLPAGKADLAKLTRALHDSKGPWRILVAHHPLDSDVPSQGIAHAIADADVRPDLLLAGHIHDLRASALEPPYPTLQIVSGGGGGSESRERALPGEIFRAQSTGFARLDLVGEGERQLLRVRLFAVSANGNVPRVVAAWTLRRDGVLENESPQVH
jgi:calcineurin-like phosphoesterase family protein